jgi:predicted RNA-binding Zn ribbon-like protein
MDLQADKLQQTNVFEDLQKACEKEAISSEILREKTEELVRANGSGDAVRTRLRKVINKKKQNFLTIYQESEI